MFFVTIFHSKVAQLFGEILCYFYKHNFYSKNCCDYFLAIFGENWATFSLTAGHTGHDQSGRNPNTNQILCHFEGQNFFSVDQSRPLFFVFFLLQNIGQTQPLCRSFQSSPQTAFYPRKNTVKWLPQDSNLNGLSRRCGGWPQDQPPFKLYNLLISQ